MQQASPHGRARSSTKTSRPHVSPHHFHGKAGSGQTTSRMRSGRRAKAILERLSKVCVLSPFVVLDGLTQPFKIFLPNTEPMIHGPEEDWIKEMDIVKHGQNDRDNTTPRLGVLDTGANINVVRERVVTELGIPRYPHELEVKGLGSTNMLNSYILLPWRLRGNTHQEYYTKFYIVPDEFDPDFDFLLGTPWLAESGYLIKNPAIRLVHSFRNVSY
jgi:hypothetical protein